MTLHVDHFASATSAHDVEPLLLIHGWGMHGGMWRSIAEQLAHDRHVMVVDLPGHGYSVAAHGEPTDACDIDTVVDQLTGQFGETITLCGWSLGGQIALRWTLRHPEQIHRLVLVATTPRFVQLGDWQCAMAADTLAEFDASLANNYAQTLRRFLALQVRGSDHERELLVELRGELFGRGQPDPEALRGGLAILRDCDLRGELPKVSQHTLVIAGERDTLTPMQASRYMAETLPRARLVEIKGAAHAPFLSHAELFLETLVSFVNE
ncbi:MAG: pimeloyl-ACP methyl ester esterase BioH [Gallionella sp.]